MRIVCSMDVSLRDLNCMLAAFMDLLLINEKVLIWKAISILCFLFNFLWQGGKTWVGSISCKEGNCIWVILDNIRFPPLHAAETPQGTGGDSRSDSHHSQCPTLQVGSWVNGGIANLERARVQWNNEIFLIDCRGSKIPCIAWEPWLTLNGTLGPPGLHPVVLRNVGVGRGARNQNQRLTCLW